ncbi:MAG: acyl-CoA thioesterase, partial [Mycobacterium sp.]|nr:acyl-CoA thioesterase [Mycobacterium sp.]
MPPAQFAMPLRVRYVECDMQGRVFNGHYLTWIDMAHSEAIRDMVGGYQVLIDRGIDVVVAAADRQFRLPAHFGEELAVGAGIDPPGRTSLRSEDLIRRGHG